jgi:hypothetical protein
LFVLYVGAIRFKAWRTNADVGIHLIVPEGSDAFDALPDLIRQLGPRVGSREGDLANLRAHYRAMMLRDHLQQAE